MAKSSSGARLAVSFLLILGAVLAGMAPASAELGNNNNVADGVTGLAPGTQTDSIETAVWAIEQIGSRIYVGGRFLQVTADNAIIDQPFLAAFDSITGDYIPSFTPVLDNSVYALEASPDGARLFVGGDFDSVNGAPYDALVALDPTTGAVDTSWSGDVNGAPVVRGFDVEGDWLYVGGSFTSVVSSAGNNAAYRALRFNVNTGAHDPSWRPVVTGGSVWGIAASPDADRVYLAGNFSDVNGNFTSGGFAAIEASTPTYVAGQPTLAFNTPNSNRRYLYDVVVANGLVWVVGSEHFVQALNESDLSLERFHLADPRGDYQDLEVIGDRVYASCHCRADAVMSSAEGVLWFPSPPAGEADAPIIAQGPTTWVAAFDAFSGDWIPTFVPDATSAMSGIWAIHGDQNGCVWFGGDITTSSGSPVDNLIRLCEAGSVDNERPSAPGAAQVQNLGPDSVDLAWNASLDNVGVAGYRLFDAITDAELISVPNQSVSLVGQAPGTYSVYVKAYDAAQNVSFRSGITTYTITGAAVDTQRPSVPGAPNPSAVGEDSVMLTWSAASDDVGVAGYRLFDADTDSVVLETPDLTVTLAGLAPGTYRYYTRAFDAAGNVSYRSGIRTVAITGAAVDTQRPSVPGAPNPSAVGEDSVMLTWSAASDDVGVAGYRLFDADTDSVVLETPDLTVTLAGLAPGTYRYYTRAFDAAGNVSYRSGIRTVAITGAAVDTQRPSVPGAPSVVQVTSDSVDLTWSAATDNVGIAGYRIFDFSTNQVVLETVGTSGTVSGLSSGTYQFYAKAFDTAGNESYRSGTRTVVVP